MIYIYDIYIYDIIYIYHIIYIYMCRYCYIDIYRYLYVFCDMQMRKFSVLVFLRHVLVSHPINLPIIYHNMLSQGHIPHSSRQFRVSALDTCSTCSKHVQNHFRFRFGTFPLLFRDFSILFCYSCIPRR